MHQTRFSLRLTALCLLCLACGPAPRVVLADFPASVSAPTQTGAPAAGIITPAQTAPLSGPGEMIGEVTAMRKVALAPKVAGRLLEAPHFAGDAVEAGKIVAKLDPRDFEISLEQATAALENAKVRLKQLETGARPEEKRAATENLKQAQANRDNAQSDLARIADLFKAGAVSKQALDAAEAKAKVTEAQYLGMKEQKALVDQGPRNEEKDAARAAVRQQEAMVKMAALQLEYASIVAPFSGLIAARQADEGAYLTNSTPVYTIVQVDPIQVLVDVPESFVARLQPGMTAEITVDALPGQKFKGSLERVPAALDPRTRVARAEVIVPNPERLLKPGMFARLHLFFPGEKPFGASGATGTNGSIAGGR